MKDSDVPGRQPELYADLTPLAREAVETFPASCEAGQVTSFYSITNVWTSLSECRRGVASPCPRRGRIGRI